MNSYFGFAAYAHFFFFPSSLPYPLNVFVMMQSPVAAPVVIHEVALASPGPDLPSSPIANISNRKFLPSLRSTLVDANLIGYEAKDALVRVLLRSRADAKSLLRLDSGFVQDLSSCTVDSSRSLVAAVSSSGGVRAWRLDLASGSATPALDVVVAAPVPGSDGNASGGASGGSAGP